MMQQYFVFVRAQPDHGHDAAVAIARKRIAHIKEVISISGKWDVLLRIEIDNRLNVAKEVINVVSGMEEVARTKTIVGYAT